MVGGIAFDDYPVDAAKPVDYEVIGASELHV